MNFMSVSKNTVESLRRSFPAGCRVILEEMNDRHAPPIGTKGTVMHVDDIGTIHVHWDNGSTLGAIYGEDVVSRVYEDVAVKEKA